MIQLIVAFGLGVVLVGAIALTVAAVRSAKQIKELQNTNRHLEEAIQDLYRELEAAKGDLYLELSRVNRKVDSKYDKSVDALKRFQEEIFSRIQYLAKKTAQDY